MKAVQVILDEDLLDRLDATPEVKQHGRSAVLRRAAEEYLRRLRNREIAEQYAAAYGRAGGLGDEFAGWEDQGQWPEE
jgi:metal-responsive CopG/Arc/MetJ family transcriptional regulator